MRNYPETLMISKKANLLCYKIWSLQYIIAVDEDKVNNTEQEEENPLKIYFFRDTQWMKTDRSQLVSKVTSL